MIDRRHISPPSGMRLQPGRFRLYGTMAALCVLCLIQGSGCALPHWMQRPEPCVFQPGAGKDEIIAHINENITGTAQRSGLRSWWANSATLQLTGTGMPVPPLKASIAAEAPRNLRLQVFNPVMGGKEVDIGSNAEEFWIWSKVSSQVALVKHEDVPIALSQLPMPVPIHPDWLMEVFGVIPLDPNEFKEVRSTVAPQEMELVALRQSPSAEPVEWVVRVDVCRGRIIERSLRKPGGEVVARALLGKYVTTPGGASLPTTIRLEWPQTGIGMTMHLSQTEVNPPALAGNPRIWTLPHLNGAEVVDIGRLAKAHLSPFEPPQRSAPARAAAELSTSVPSQPSATPTDRGWADATPGRVQLASEGVEEELENPFAKYRRPVGSAEFEVDKQPLTDAPLWSSPPGGQPPQRP